MRTADGAMSRTLPTPRRHLAAVLALLVVVCAIVLWCLCGDAAHVPPDVPHASHGDEAAIGSALTAATPSERTDAAIVEPAGDATALLTGTLTHADGTAVGGADIWLVDETGSQRQTW